MLHTDSITELILESISDGVFTVDSEWRITSFNAAAERITGMKRSAAIGSPCFEVFKSNMCETDCPLRKTLKTRKPLINKTGYLINLKGQRIPISVSTAPLLDEKGRMLGGAETFRDLSEIDELRKELKIRNSFGDMSSSSPSMNEIFDLLPVIVDTPSAVLIQGETGTGKELLARSIHSLSRRSKEPFIAVNCGALPDTLLESELFGYKKGAFTGAERDKAGRFALANKGTLFLDEIGDMSEHMQVKLLRVLQEHEYEPLGSIRTEKTKARVVCATNRDLRALVQENKFRKDLFYRINVITLKLPPLRKRKEDIPLLAEGFLRKFNRLAGKDIAGFCTNVFSFFYAYDWPGNIRELENVIERAVVLCSRKVIDAELLPVEIAGSSVDRFEEGNIFTARDQTERQCIIRALQKNGYKRADTAHDLGIDKATLYRKIKKYAIRISKKADQQ